jgi:hypothetical protein
MKSLNISYASLLQLQNCVTTKMMCELDSPFNQKFMKVHHLKIVK